MFVASRSILKSKTPERVLAPEEQEPAAVLKQRGREMTPPPDDPLRCPTYLSSPMSTIIASVTVTPSPNRIDGEVGDIFGPLPMSLHDLAEAYTLMLSRLRLQAMTVAPDGSAIEVEISSDLPLLEPIRQHHAELATALARDVGRALVRPSSFLAPTPYQPVDVDAWSSDYSSDVFGSSSPPGSPAGPTQKRGLTAAEVKYARDLSLVSQSAIRVMAVVFHEPAVSSHFTDDELIEMLNVLISIPNTMPLPTPNPRKTHTAALWALQMVRLPLHVMQAPGVANSLFEALQMAVQGRLGREGKKGSTSEGLTAVQMLATHYPCIFGPLLPALIGDIIRCLTSPMVLIRQRAALSLGGIVQGLFDWEEEEEVSANDSGKALDLTPISEIRKAISEAVVDAFDLQKNSKNAVMLKTIKDILSQFGPDSSTQLAKPGDTPHWALSVLASLVTLLERNFFLCEAMHTAVVACARIVLNAKKAAIRSAGSLLWSCVVWAWKRFDAQDSTRGEGADSLVNEKIMAQVVVEHVGFGVVASLMGALDRPDAVKARRVRRIARSVRNMIEENCTGAPELLARLLSPEDSSTPSANPMAIDRKLVPTGLLTQQLVGADMKALATAVNTNVAQGIKTEDIRPLTTDERVAEWPMLFATWKHFPGTLPMTSDGEPAEILLSTWRALLLATTHVENHIPCFVAIAESMTAFANSKHDDPQQIALTLTFVRRLWAIVHEVFFNPLSSNTLLADFSADLIQTLAQRPPDLSKKVVREAWVTLLAEVLASGTLDSSETLCDVLPGSLWGSVYAGVVTKYAEEPNFEGGLVLCGVPFNENYAWVLSEDDWSAWSSLAHALVVNEGEQVFSNLLTMIGSGQAIPTASTLRPLSILLSFSELPVSESDGTFINLLSMANDRLRAEYGSCLSPETLESVIDLISALRGIITPDPLCLEIIEAVQSGMQQWIEDEQFVLSDQEFNDGPIMFYAHVMQGLTAVPDELLDIGKLAPFLASAFSRIPAPGAGPLAFSLFWNQKFAKREPPPGGYPEILKPCLRGILNIDELIEVGISLGTDLGEETQPAENSTAPIAADEACETQAEDPDRATVAEQADMSIDKGNVSVESVEMADASTSRVDTSVEGEVVQSSVEEIDQLADDSGVVEETIVYEPPSRSRSVSPRRTEPTCTSVPAPAEPEPAKADSQLVPESQPEPTESAPTQTRKIPVFASVCESPRKRKSEDAFSPSKRSRGLFIADPEIESLPILKFPSPARSSSPSSCSVIDESVFYSPSKYNVPPPAWSPTGVLQPLPTVSSPKVTTSSEEETVEETPVEETPETIGDVSADESAEAETSTGDVSDGDISDLPDSVLADLPDITMSLPTRKKRMTVVVEVPRVEEVLKRWSSDSTGRSVPATTPRKEKPGLPERVRRTRSWSKAPAAQDKAPVFESTPSRRPLKRRRSDRESLTGTDAGAETPAEPTPFVLRSRRASTQKQPGTSTPKSLGTELFDEGSPIETPSLRRVKSMPGDRSFSDLLAGMSLSAKAMGRVASVAAAGQAARAESVPSASTAESVQPVETPQPEAATDDTKAQAPVTRSTSLEALMVDAEALAELDLAELLRQQEMLAAMKEQVAKALALKQERSVGTKAA